MISDQVGFGRRRYGFSRGASLISSSGRIPCTLPFSGRFDTSDAADKGTGGSGASLLVLDAIYRILFRIGGWFVVYSGGRTGERCKGEERCVAIAIADTTARADGQFV